MRVHLGAQLQEIRLDLHGRWLRRQERAALRRLGRAVARRVGDGDPDDVRRLSRALQDGERRIDALAFERAASLDADHADLGRVAGWVKPAVVARGICARAVLNHRIAAARRSLRPQYEALGRAAAPSLGGGQVEDLAVARARLRRLAEEREAGLGEYGGSAHPVWVRRAGAEAAGLGRAFWIQLRSALVPKLPALAGMAMGWWIANTYTDSHVRSVLRSVGIGSGGTHVVSGSTYRAMHFWLPLLAAAVCAYAGERLAAAYRSRAHLGLRASTRE